MNRYRIIQPGQSYTFCKYNVNNQLKGKYSDIKVFDTQIPDLCDQLKIYRQDHKKTSVGKECRDVACKVSTRVSRHAYLIFGEV